MLNKKSERYWKNLDISDEWKIFLENNYDLMSAQNNEYYKNTRSFDNMREEFVSQLSKNQQQDREFSEYTDMKELIKKEKVEAELREYSTDKRYSGSYDDFPTKNRFAYAQSLGTGKYITNKN